MPEVEEGVLKAEIDLEDGLAVDNVAWLALRPAAILDVLLVADADAQSSFFLQRVLAPDPRVNLSTIAPEQYMESDAFDLTIFRQLLPGHTPFGNAHLHQRRAAGGRHLGRRRH